MPKNDTMRQKRGNTSPKRTSKQENAIGDGAYRKTPHTSAFRSLLDKWKCRNPDVRKARRKRKEARRKHRMERRRHAAFRLCRAFRHYCFFLLFALIFTQALRSSISGMLFVFALILPIISLIYAIVARLSLTASVHQERTETVKGVPIQLRISVRNGSILPLPFVEAFLLIPDDDAVRCRSRLAHLTLMPRSTYTYERSVAFPYCGEYTIGVTEVFVGDPLRLFRLRVSARASQTIFVAPYQAVMTPDGQNAISELTTETAARRHGADRTEVTDIRNYRAGDPMKNIHWKLSSKTEELQVKEFGVNVGKSAFIICDPSQRFLSDEDAERSPYADDINEYAADAVIGAGIAAAARELEDGNTCTLVWYDSRCQSGLQVHTLESRAALEAVIRLFASTPIAPSHRGLTDLLSLIDDTQGISLLFITPLPDERLVREITDASVFFHQVGNSGAVSLYTVDVSRKIVDADTAAQYRTRTELSAALLTGNGVTVYRAQAFMHA